jgi:branched-chain amino acid transport system permease protein
LIGVIIAILLSAFVGAVVGRFKGDYFALVSLGFSVIIYSVFLNWQSLTNGPLGIAGVSRPVLFNINFSDNLIFLILILIFLVGTYLFARFIGLSSFGRALRAIREDEQALSVFGYKTSLYKFLIFIIGSSIAAIAGSLFAGYISFVDPSSFTLSESIFIFSLIILGGLQSQKGAMLGAFMLVIIPEALRFVGFSSDIAAQMRELLYGLLLVLLMMYRPQGFVGEYKL